MLSASGDRASAKAAIDATLARGDTALYDAVHQSIQALEKVEGRKAVILLSDGVDDDGQGKQLSKHSIEEGLELARKVNVPVFTIGLGAEIDEQVLQRVAESTGGKYFSVADPAALQQVYDAIGKQLSGQYTIEYTSDLPSDGTVHRVVLLHADSRGMKEFQSPGSVSISSAVAAREAVDEPVIAEPTRVRSATTLTISDKPGLHIGAVAREGDTEFLRDVTFKIFQDAGLSDSKSIENCYSAEKCTISVAPGKYRILVQKGDAEAEEEVEVVSGANNVIVELKAGALRVEAVAVAGGTIEKMTKAVISKEAGLSGERKTVSNCYSSDRCNFILNEGKYSLTVEKGNASTTEDIEIKSGEATSRVVVLDAGSVTVKAVPSAGSPIMKFEKVTVSKLSGALGESVKVDDCYQNTVCTFVLKAGRYEVMAAKGAASVSQQIEITGGKDVPVVMDLNAGVVNIVVRDGQGQPLKATGLGIETVPNAMNEKFRVSGCRYDTKCSLTVHAGRYIAYADVGDNTVTQEVEVTAGGINELELNFVK